MKGNTWIYVFVTSAIVHLSAADKFSVQVSNDGDYKIYVGDTRWLRSGPTWFRMNGKVYSTADHSLKLKNTEKLSSLSDNLGEFDAQMFEYEANGNIFQTYIVTYPDLPNVVIFGQKYLNDTLKTSTGDISKVVSGYPTFQLDKDASSSDLGYYAPRGYFVGSWDPVFKRWNQKDADFKDGYKIGPMAVYDSKGQDTVVISHFSNFMAASYWYDNSTGVLNVGIQGKAEMVPELYDLWTVVYYNDGGINQAFEGWGAVMQKFYQSQNAKYAEADFITNYLGYWTDNGAYYYYNTEPNKTFEGSLLDVWKYTQKEGIPFRYHQYDSWLYPRNDTDLGMLAWYPLPSAFPHTAHYLQAQTGLPAAAHQRFWSPHTPLAKQNGGPYEFDVASKFALPLDAKLWEDILINSTAWGNRNLVQDWIGQMYETIELLQTNVTVGRIHMHHMSNGAQKAGLTIELCTPFPRHILQGLEMPTVTFARATTDYQPNSEQWRIGPTTMILNALGQQSFKDPYWSTTNQNCPKYPGAKEPYPELESVVSSLGAGPVGVADGVGKSNKTIIMRCCDENGLILKPSRPATSIDAYYLGKTFGAGMGIPEEVWSTHCMLSTMFFGILFGADFSKGATYTITPSLLGWKNKMGTSHQYKIFSRTNPSVLKDFSETEPLPLTGCTKTNFCLYYASPVFKISGKDVVLLGELDKWIPFSPKRFRQLEIFGDLGLTIQGAVGEVVNVSVFVDNTVKTISCRISEKGTAVMRVLPGTCDYDDL